MKPRWRARPWPEAKTLVRLVEAFRVPPMMAAALWGRGFRRRLDLEPELRPWRFPALDQGARVLVEAIKRGQRIRVHGDYDADGITGTAILVKGLEALGAEVHPFIPRREEGYGISEARVPEHAAEADVFVTVDCGITNHAELKSLVEDGVSVVVTDHHTPGDAPPPGTVVHPAYDPGLRGRPKPTGAGVAFFLLWAVYDRLGKPPPLAFSDLAAVGTIADVAPLLGVNRAIVREGLSRLPASEHLGLRLLAERHLSQRTALEVAFRIAPRINAAGRLGEPETALALLLTDDFFEANQLAARLDALNQERQRVEEAMLTRLLPTLDPEAPAHVVHDPEGHPGVMGIVASRILERTYKPVFIIAQGKGSVRSVPGVSAVGALAAAAHTLKGYGGHAQAAGFSIDEAAIPAFREAIYAYVEAQPKPRPEVWLEGPLSREVLPEIWQALERFEPIGEGNPEPLFHLRGVPDRVRPLSGGKHVGFALEGLRVIKWRDSGEGLRGEVEVAAAVVLNEWNGSASLELRAEAYRDPDRIYGQGRDCHLVRMALRQALEQAVSAKVPVFARGEGAAWLKARGALLVGPEAARLWLALPERRVRIQPGTALALGEKWLQALSTPRVTLTGFRRALAARARGKTPPFPYNVIIEELGGRDDPYDSPTYRLLATVDAFAQRFVWAYRYGDSGLLCEALSGLWEAWDVQVQTGKIPGQGLHPAL